MQEHLVNDILYSIQNIYEKCDAKNHKLSVEKKSPLVGDLTTKENSLQIGLSKITDIVKKFEIAKLFLSTLSIYMKINRIHNKNRKLLSLYLCI